MKLLLVALALTSAAASSTSESEFLVEFGPSHDAGSVMSKLTGMMGEAQQKLAIAERHHKKVVKKVRKEAEAFLQQESDAYGKYLQEYSAELAKVTEELQDAVDSAKAGIAKSEATPSSTNDWKDPLVEQRAKLGAQVAAAERNIKRAERRQTRSVREAEERAEENMEDEAQKLGMKLGDMTPLVDKAKQTLEAAAEKAPVLAAGKTTAKSDAAAKKVDLKNLQDNLAKANKDNTAKTSDANKRLDGFLTKTGQDVADKAKKIQGDLETEQKTEIEKVLGRKAAAPAAKKAAPAKKVETVKAAPAKAVPAKATAKAVKK